MMSSWLVVYLFSDMLIPLAKHPTIILKSPIGLHPSSSSPNKRRYGSAERVVLPVPDKPKNRATSPSSPTLLEQCIGKTFLSGKRQFITEKIDFSCHRHIWFRR